MCGILHRPCPKVAATQGNTPDLAVSPYGTKEPFSAIEGMLNKNTLADRKDQEPEVLPKGYRQWRHMMDKDMRDNPVQAGPWKRCSCGAVVSKLEPYCPVCGV
jgi:hypothetical protein